jgi:hypothetical protein
MRMTSVLCQPVTGRLPGEVAMGIILEESANAFLICAHVDGKVKRLRLVTLERG